MCRRQLGVAFFLAGSVATEEILSTFTIHLKQLANYQVYVLYYGACLIIRIFQNVIHMLFPVPI